MMKRFSILVLLFGFYLFQAGCGSKSSSPSSPSGSGGPAYTYPFLGNFGGNDQDDPIQPVQIWVHNGTLFVGDSNDELIQKFDLNGNFLAQFPIGGGGDVTGVAVDGNGLVYVGDDNNDLLNEYDLNGNFITSWAAGPSGLNAGFVPWNIYVDTSNNVYMVDYQGCDCVVKKSSGATTWVTGSTGYLGDGWDLTMGHDGNLYVPDHSTGLVYIVNPATMVLDSPVSVIAKVGPSGPTTLEGPSSIATDPDGNLLLTDETQNLVVKMTTSGSLLTTIQNTSFNDLEAVAVDPSKDVFVGDYGANTIFKFAPY